MKQSDGIIPVYKPRGFTSNDALKLVKKRISCRKIGHAGTLDPGAEGLLILLINEAVKLQEYFMNAEKSYTAEAVFGEQKDTDDYCGKTVKSYSGTDLKKRFSETDFCALFHKYFSGKISQIPPAYSACYINGERSYHLARRGLDVFPQAREVTIHSFSILSAENGVLRFSLTCSAGTYIRSIIRDLGAITGLHAYCSSLLRTASGNISLKTAHTPDVITAASIIPLGESLSFTGTFNINENNIRKVQYADFREFNFSGSGAYGFFTSSGGLQYIVFYRTSGVKHSYRLLGPMLE